MPDVRWVNVVYTEDAASERKHRSGFLPGDPLQRPIGAGESPRGGVVATALSAIEQLYRIVGLGGNETFPVCLR